MKLLKQAWGPLLLVGLAPVAQADVFYFTDEAAYRAKAAQLGYATWGEDFNSASWNAYRTTADIYGNYDYHVAQSITVNGITWQAKSTLTSPGSLYITTAGYPYGYLPGDSTPEERWAITPITRRTDYEAIGGSSGMPLFAVGGWLTGQLGYKFDENCACWIPATHITVTIDGVTSDFGAGGDQDPYHVVNALVYTLSTPTPTVAGVITGPRFFGVINTGGFTTFSFNSDVGNTVDLKGGHVGYYGPMLYGDNFTFAAALPVPEPSTWAMLLAGLAGVAARARGTGRLPAAQVV